LTNHSPSISTTVPSSTPSGSAVTISVSSRSAFVSSLFSTTS
jgi:hypothetical protein